MARELTPLLAAVAICISGPALAQQCYHADKLAEGLQKEHGELPLFIGTAGDTDKRIIVYWNPKTQTWTITQDHPMLPNVACPVASGENGQAARPAMKEGPTL